MTPSKLNQLDVTLWHFFIVQHVSNVITFETCWTIKKCHKVTLSWFNLFNYQNDRLAVGTAVCSLCMMNGLTSLTFRHRNYFFNFSTPVYKMWIIQEPNMLELWNKLHFEEEKNGEYIPCLKYSVPIFVE